MFLLLLGSAVYPLSAAARPTRPAASSASVAAATAAEEPSFDVTRDGDAAMSASGTLLVATGDEATSSVPATAMQAAMVAEPFGFPVDQPPAPDGDGLTDGAPADTPSSAPGSGADAAPPLPTTASGGLSADASDATAGGPPAADAQDLESATDQSASSDASLAPPLVDRISHYRVALGENLTSIAARFGIGMDTLRWANALPADPNLLFVGQELTVLPVDGVLYAVLAGDTLQSVATAARVSVGDLAQANGLPEDAALEVGRRLLVPGGRPVTATFPTTSHPWPLLGSGTASYQQFIQAAVPLAQDVQRQTGVPASVTIAQAILESDWGTSSLTRAANNFFGIKATDYPNTNDVYWSDTWEVVDGEDLVVRAPFRAYKTPWDSFLDHGQFFLRSRRYAAALLVTSNPQEFARAIADAGDATDPAYARKLIALMDQYRLYQYDSPADVHLTVPPSTARSSPDSPNAADGGATAAPDGAFDCHCWMVPVRPPASPAAT